MEALTVAELRSLAKLHRAGVDGATERLRQIVQDEREALPALLGFPPENLTRLLDEENAVALLVATIEGAPRVAREARLRDENARAQNIANELGRQLVLDGAGDCEVPVGALVLLTQLGDHRHVAFGERGGIPTRRLRDLFHACRRVSACSVLLRELTLDVVYTTTCSRGFVRLHLSMAAAYDRAVVVPVPELAKPAPVVEVPSLASPVEREREPAPAPQPGPRPSPRNFGHRFVEALLAAALGGVG